MRTRKTCTCVWKNFYLFFYLFQIFHHSALAILFLRIKQKHERKHSLVKKLISIKLKNSSRCQTFRRKTIDIAFDVFCKWEMEDEDKKNKKQEKQKEKKSKKEREIRREKEKRARGLHLNRIGLISDLWFANCVARDHFPLFRIVIRIFLFFSFFKKISKSTYLINDFYYTPRVKKYYFVHQFI